jgi:hypothetical protein
MRTYKQDRKDMDRVWGPAKRAARYPSEAELLEVIYLKVVRDKLRDGKLNIRSMKAQFGGHDRESTIRKAAKVLAYYHNQIDVLEDADGIPVGVTVPPGLKETIEAIRGKED